MAVPTNESVLSAESIRAAWHQAMQDGRFPEAQAIFEDHFTANQWPDLTPLDHPGLAPDGPQNAPAVTDDLTPLTPLAGPVRSDRRDLAPIGHMWETSARRDLSVPTGVTEASPQMPLDARLGAETTDGAHRPGFMSRAPRNRGLRRLD